MSSYPSPRFFSSPSSSSSSSSTTTPFLRDPYQMSYHHAHPPSMYYPFSPPFDGSVNLNNPYIYDPNHVKHRRRTTPEQLKVLEETFKTDPKPNPTLRKRLSSELGMTPRVLQVWFQNRRMKVKRLVKKQNSSTDQVLVDSVTNDYVDGQQQSEDSSSSTCVSHSTAIATGPTDGTASASASASTPIPTPPSGSSSSTPAPSPSSPLPYPDLTLRRSSLPLAVGFNSGSNHHPSFHDFHQQQHQSLNHYQHHGVSWNANGDDNNNNGNAIHHSIASNLSAGGNDLAFDPLTDPLLLRRRSFTSLHRLESHPFAPLVAAGNGVSISSHTRKSQTPFRLQPDASSTSSANSESRLDASACASPSDRLSVDNSPSVSATVSFPAAGAPDGVAKAFSTSDLDSLDHQALVHTHPSNMLSPTKETKILDSEAAANVDLGKNDLDGSIPTTETILRCTDSEGIQRQHDPMATLVETQGQTSSASVQQIPSFLQRSQSTSQARPFITHHHSSSTPPHITHKASQSQASNSTSISNNPPSHATHFTHLHTNTSMGVVQPGFKSASFHGINPNSDNYHSYYNRQMLTGQNFLVGRHKDIGMQKKLNTGNGQQSLSVSSGRRLHPTLSTLQQQQFSNTHARDHMHTTSRSIPPTPLLDYSTSHNAEILGQTSQPYQHTHHCSLPAQSEVDMSITHPPYAFPPRPLGALLPGPLPAADYSFGTATSSNTETDSEMHEKQSEIRDEKQHYIPWDHTETGVDTLHNGGHTLESSSIASAYDDNMERGYQSRFGSLASVMSVPSVPSASEGGATAEWEWDWESEGLRGTIDGRRGSCTGQVAELFSNLEVGSRRGSEESINSAPSLSTSNGISGHNIHPRDPNETQELSYPVPDMIFHRDSVSHAIRNRDKLAANHENTKEKRYESEQDDEDQRKTPSAQTGESRNFSSDTSKTQLHQPQNIVSGKRTHADEIDSPYSQIQSQLLYYDPVSHFYNAGIGAEYAVNEFEVARDVADHGSMNMGMNFGMSVDLGAQFQFQGVNVDYGSQGTEGFSISADDNMLGVERYTGMPGGSYDEIY